MTVLTQLSLQCTMQRPPKNLYLQDATAYLGLGVGAPGSKALSPQASLPNLSAQPSATGLSPSATGLLVPGPAEPSTIELSYLDEFDVKVVKSTAASGRSAALVNQPWRGRHAP